MARHLTSRRHPGHGSARTRGGLDGPTLEENSTLPEPVDTTAPIRSGMALFSMSGSRAVSFQERPDPRPNRSSCGCH